MEPVAKSGESERFAAQLAAIEAGLKGSERCRLVSRDEVMRWLDDLTAGKLSAGMRHP